LVLDEVQKVPRWSETVKRLRDADTRGRRALKVVLLASAPLLIRQGMTESLAGRFEIVQHDDAGALPAKSGVSLADARRDRQFWGRVVESAVSGHLANAAAACICELFYWRERSHEVDFVVSAGKAVTGFVPRPRGVRGRVPTRGSYSSGGDGIAVEEFLERPVEHWGKP
jgi:predicted AAA+ superfamily ATPase